MVYRWFGSGRASFFSKTLLPRAPLVQAGAGMNLAIIGLGYVGLPLCLQFSRSGVRVLGLDIDAKKVSALNAGRSYIKHISAGEIKKLVRAGKFSASTDFAQIKNVAAILICVPTPLKKNRAPDLSFVLNTGKSIAPQMRRDAFASIQNER